MELTRKRKTAKSVVLILILWVSTIRFNKKFFHLIENNFILQNINVGGRVFLMLITKGIGQQHISSFLNDLRSGSWSKDTNFFKVNRFLKLTDFSPLISCTFDPT